MAEWGALETGAPILKNALVSFDCEISQIQEVGTHTIFICPIVTPFKKINKIRRWFILIVTIIKLVKLSLFNSL